MNATITSNGNGTFTLHVQRTLTLLDGTLVPVCDTISFPSWEEAENARIDSVRQTERSLYLAFTYARRVRQTGGSPMAELICARNLADFAENQGLPEAVIYRATANDVAQFCRIDMFS